MTRAASTSGLWRFVAAGVGDAVHRLSRFTVPTAPDETDALGVVETSVAVGSLDRALDRFRAAAGASVIVGVLAARWAAWRGQPPVARTRNTGIALLTAAGVHMALSLWQGPVAGWLWLVAPGVAAAFGALMACAPSRAFSGEERT